jgi:hypothetical protein
MSAFFSASLEEESAGIAEYRRERCVDVGREGRGVERG